MTSPDWNGPVCLHDFEAQAAQQLPDAASAYLFGGSADEVTLAGNRAAFDRLWLRPRLARDLAGGTTASSVLGVT